MSHGISGPTSIDSRWAVDARHTLRAVRDYLNTGKGTTLRGTKWTGWNNQGLFGVSVDKVIFFDDDFSRFANAIDIAIVKTVGRSSALRIAPLYSGTDEVGRVGSGASHANNRRDGNDNDRKPENQSTSNSTRPYEVRWVGRNNIDRVDTQALGSPANALLKADFDHPSNTSKSIMGGNLAIDLEYGTMGGDSGSPIYADRGSVPAMIAGVLSGGSGSVYGSSLVYVRIRPYTTWITDTILANPDNRTLALSVPNQEVPLGDEVTLKAAPTSSDAPPLSYTYSLVNPPAGATINPVSGEFSWTPGNSEAGKTTAITIRVVQNGVVAKSTTATFDVAVSADRANLQWTPTSAGAGGSGNWSTEIANWDPGEELPHVAWPTSGTNNDAIFGGSAGLVPLWTPITANDITFNTTGYSIAAEEGNSLTLNGANAKLTTGTDVSATIGAGITGSGTSISKLGAGTLVFSAANTYTGQTDISAGILQMSGAGTPGAAGSTVTIAPEALLDLNGTNQAVLLGAGAGGIANNSGSGTSVLTLTGLQNSIIHDSTTSPGGIIATIFNATPNITGTSTFSGGTTINAGRFVQLSATTATLGTGEVHLTAVNSSLLGGAAPSLTIANDISGLGSVSNNVNGAGTIVLTGLLTNTGSYTFRNAGNVYDFASARDNTLNAVIGGANGVNNNTKAGSIIKSGTGKLTLTQANLYTGATTVSAGTLNIQNNTALGATAGGVTVSAGGVLELEGGITVGAQELSVRGGGISNGGALRNLAGNNTYGGAVTLPSNARFNSLSGSLTLTNTINTGGFFLVMSGVGDINLSGVISGTASASANDIAKDAFNDGGTGTLTLSGLNTYSGRTVISGGTLKLGAAGNATHSPLGTIAGGTFVSGTGTLDLAGFTLGTAEALSLAGSGIDDSGALANSGEAASYSGLVTLAGNASIIAGGDIALTHTGMIAGAGFDLTLGGTATGSTLASAIGTGTGSLIKTGSGTWTLTGENTYTGATIVSGGTLSLTSPTLADDSPVSTAAGTVLNLNFTGTNVVGSLILGGVPKDPGTYTAANSPGLITGDGAIQAGGVAPAGDFTSWAAANGIPGEPASGDFDNDGISNLMEYALGLDPTRPSLPAGTFSGNTLTFTKGNEAVANGDVIYEIEQSTTLADWAPVTPTENTATTISYTLPAGQLQVFVRLKILKAP